MEILSHNINIFVFLLELDALFFIAGSGEVDKDGQAFADHYNCDISSGKIKF